MKIKLQIKESKILTKSSDLNIKTYGDLKRLANKIVRLKKDQAGEDYIKRILGNITGIDWIKNTYDFFSVFYRLPDDKRTNTFLDRLDVDDEMSKIMDEKVENMFINHFVNFLNSKNDNEVIPNDFSATKELQNFLMNTFKGRTIVNQSNV